MIACTPIVKKIRDKLENKKRILGREIPEAGTTVSDINEDGVFLKTTFIRMTSNPKDEEQITLMGGELKSDGSLYVGYEQKYGARKGLDNKFKRPIAGIKNIDVNYEGGLKARRKAVVNWTCWSLEDLERFRRHFLAHGKTVLLEWGFSKKGESFITPFDENGKILQDVFTSNTQKYNLDNNGDYDLLAGYVSNFEWTTRDDGAFDCTTDIVGLGVNMTDSYNRPSEFNFKTEMKRNGWKFWEKEEVISEGQEDEVYKFDAALTISAVAKKLKEKIKIIHFGDSKFYQNKEQIKNLATGPIEILPRVFKKGFQKNYICYYENGTLAQYDAPPAPRGGMIELNPEDVYVSWGWFEDNFLNKFISLCNDDEAVIRFRSINPILKSDETGYELNEDGSLLFESTKIKTHPIYKTTNFNTFVFPGITPKNLDGRFKNIASFIQSNSSDIPQFTDPNDDRRGFLRNILINVDEIVDIFENKQPNSVKSIMENLIGSLNEDIDLWDLKIETDTEDQSLLKVVDSNVVYKKPKDYIEEANEAEGGINNKNNLFVFPTWRHNSFVKSQNLVSRVPSAMQMATMYGSNVPATRTPSVPDADVDPIGFYTGLLGNDENFKDAKLRNLMFPFRKGASGDIAWKKFGSLNPNDPNTPLEKNAGPDLSLTAEEIKKLLVDEVSSKKSQETEEPTPPPTGDGETKEAQNVRLSVEKLNQYTDIKIYNIDGVMNERYLQELRYKLLGNPGTAEADNDPLIPIELDLSIEGVSGIYPGNAFQIAYIPKRYRDLVVFQTFEVGHSVDSTGWSVSIKGVMRLSASNKYGLENAELLSERIKVDPPTPLSKQIDDFIESTAAGDAYSAVKSGIRKGFAEVKSWFNK